MKEPRRPCCHPGCRTLASPGGHHCPVHLAEYREKELKRQRAVNAKRDKVMGRMYSHKWRTASRHHLRRYPICEVCGRPATQVDHRVPHRGDPTLFWDRSNWSPLCHSCHSRKTARENRGRQRKTPTPPSRSVPE